MLQSRFWWFLAVLFGLTAIIFSGLTFYEWVAYQRLNALTALDKVDWQVNKISDEKYFLEAFYLYRVNNQIFKGNTRLKNFFRNEFAAQEAVLKYKQEMKTVWFDSANPSHSQLIHIFPWKRFLSMIILWGLFFYWMRFGLNAYRFFG